MYSDVGDITVAKAWSLLLWSSQLQRRFPDPYTDISDALRETLELQ